MISHIIIGARIDNEILDLIQSIRKYSVTNHEILVVTETLIEKSIQKDKDIKLIFTEKETGFATKVNKGFEHSTNSLIHVLTSKSRYVSSLKDIVIFYQKLGHEKPIILGSKLLLNNQGVNYVHKGYGDFPSMYSFFLKRIKSIFMLSLFLDKFKLFKKNNLLIKDDEQPSYINHNSESYVYGGNMFFNSVAFKLVNGLDENFRLYYEEVDFQKRLLKHKVKIYTTNQILISRIGGTYFNSNPQDRINRRVNRDIGFLMYLERHQPFFYRVSIVLMIFLSIFEIFISLYRKTYSLADYKILIGRIYEKACAKK